MQAALLACVDDPQNYSRQLREAISGVLKTAPGGTSSEGPYTVRLIVVRGAGPDTALSRVSEPVCCGVPLPRGALVDERGCRLMDAEGAAVAVQCTALSRWPDGSVKWLFAEFAVAGGAQDGTYTLEMNRTAGERAATVNANQPAALGTHEASGLHLRGGGSAVRIDGNTAHISCAADSGQAAIGLEIIDLHGVVHDFKWTDASLEWNGTQRTTARVTGDVKLQEKRLRVEVRFFSYACSPVVRIDVTVHNPARARHQDNFWELGDSGSILLKGLRVVLTPRAVPERVAIEELSSGLMVAAPATVYQEASGGENWNSRVHVNRNGIVPMTTRGYVITSDDANVSGSRAQPVAHASFDSCSLSAAVLRFWQEFPSSVRALPSGRLELSLLPEQFPSLHELQGGERKTRSCIVAVGPAADTRSAIAATLQPALVRCDPDAIRRSDAISMFDAPSDARHDALTNLAIEGPQSFDAKREMLDEYGWRNFGDLYADHENAYATSPPIVSHYNNQYDAIAGFAIQFLRTGDTRWWRLMDDLARHVVDIDLYHTGEDKSAYNGGLFWHTYHYVDAGLATHRAYPRAAGAGGGPSAEHNYNAGLALHYWLTGWLPSRDAAVAMGEWVLAMDDGRTTPFRWLASGPTGLASASGNPLYHGPGRAGGNSIAALVVAFELSGNRRFLRKAEQLIRRCIHPFDEIATLDLLDAERRWFYTVFLQSIAQYLRCKRDLNEIDAEYEYARRSLVHYAEWMCVHEYPYLERPEGLEYPTETWSAQDMRKSDVLAAAALCTTDPEQRRRFLAVSRRFHEDVLQRLPSLPTHSYTRPIVLLLTRGYALRWVEAHPEARLPASPDLRLDFERSRFEPQKARAIRRLKLLAVAFFLATIVAAVALLL